MSKIRIGAFSGLIARARIARARVPITRLGLAVIAVALVAWLLAARYGWSEATLVATGALLLIAVAVPFLFRRGSFTSTLDVGPTDRVKVNEPCLGSVVVTNTGSVRSLPQQLEVQMGDGVAKFNVASIAPQAASEAMPFEVPTDRRAVIDVGPVTMVRGDPLGLFRRDASYTQRMRVYVHPEHSVGLGLSTGFLRDVDGPTFDNNPRGDAEFHTIREYVRGDDRRHIHWKSTARTGTTMVRQYVDNRRPELVIAIDDCRGSYGSEEEFERALEAVATAEASCFNARQTVVHHRSSGRAPGRSLNDLLDDLSAATLVQRDSLLHTTGRTMAMDRNATIGLLVTGSLARPQLVQRCSYQIERSMRSIVVRVVPGRVSLRESANGIVMQVDSLKDFVRLWRGVCSR